MSELFDLERDLKVKFLEEMSEVAEAVSKAFDAEKMNYELLGNAETHLPWHLFPRVDGDLGEHGNNGKDSVWWLPMEEMYSEQNKANLENIQRLKDKLLLNLPKA